MDVLGLILLIIIIRMIFGKDKTKGCGGRIYQNPKPKGERSKPCNFSIHGKDGEVK